MRKKTIIMSLLLFIFYIVPRNVLADTENNVGFTINASIPENQVDKNQSYFDLRMTPNQEQEISIQITNTSDADSQFKVNINQAYTNRSGFIDYSDSDIKADSSLPYEIADIVNYEPTVEVKANSSLRYPITLKMPTEQFDGSIMAGIQVVKETTGNANGITNKYGYILGLKLTETENPVKRKLNLLGVNPAVSFSRTSVVANLQNPTMDAYGHLKYEAKVTNVKTGELEKEVRYDENMQLAPNSVYDFAIDWDDRRLVAGKYLLDLVVSDAKNNRWEFSEAFTITKKEAKEINKVTIDKAKENSLFKYIIILIIVLLFLVVLFGLYIIKQKRRDEK